MVNKPLPADQLKPSPMHLIHVAEKLFAEHGVDAISTREIARIAGQKNHSAVRYHFGSKDALIQSILDLRLLPINKRRQQLLNALEQCHRTHDITGLVRVLVIPYAEELQTNPDDNHYIGFIAQLCAHYRGEQLLLQNPQRISAIHSVSSYLLEALSELPQAVVEARLQLMGAQINQAIAKWDTHRRLDDQNYADTQLNWLTENLVDVISAGLSAPVSERTLAQLNN